MKNFLTILLASVAIMFTQCGKTDDFTPSSSTKELQNSPKVTERSYYVVEIPNGGGGTGIPSGFTCRWSDGVGGDVNCLGHHCALVTYGSQIGIGCFNEDETLINSGAFR